MGAEPRHGAAELDDHRGRLLVVLAITIAVLAVEVVGAVISGSLALLSDAGHMLTDVAGLTMAVIASALARRPASDARTWGYHAPRYPPQSDSLRSFSRSGCSSSSRASSGSSSRRR